MIDCANQNGATAREHSLVLCMAAEAQVGVRLRKQLAVDGAVRVMAGGAPLPHGFVFERDRTCLFPMTLGTTLILPRHCQSAGRFEDIHAVRVMALDTIHPVLNDRVMMGELKLHVRLKVTGKTSCRVAPGIVNVFTAPTTCCDVQAARAMT